MPINTENILQELCKEIMDSYDKEIRTKTASDALSTMISCANVIYLSLFNHMSATKEKTKLARIKKVDEKQYKAINVLYKSLNPPSEPFQLCMTKDNFKKWIDNTATLGIKTRSSPGYCAAIVEYTIGSMREKRLVHIYYEKEIPTLSEQTKHLSLTDQIINNPKNTIQKAVALAVESVIQLNMSYHLAAGQLENFVLNNEDIKHVRSLAEGKKYADVIRQIHTERDIACSTDTSNTRQSSSNTTALSHTNASASQSTLAVATSRVTQQTRDALSAHDSASTGKSNVIHATSALKNTDVIQSVKTRQVTFADDPDYARPMKYKQSKATDNSTARAPSCSTQSPAVTSSSHTDVDSLSDDSSIQRFNNELQNEIGYEDLDKVIAEFECKYLELQKPSSSTNINNLTSRSPSLLTIHNNRGDSPDRPFSQQLHRSSTMSLHSISASSVTSVSSCSSSISNSDATRHAQMSNNNNDNDSQVPAVIQNNERDILINQQISDNRLRTLDGNTTPTSSGSSVNSVPTLQPLNTFGQSNNDARTWDRLSKSSNDTASSSYASIMSDNEKQQSISGLPSNNRQASDTASSSHASIMSDNEKQQSISGFPINNRQASDTSSSSHASITPDNEEQQSISGFPINNRQASDTASDTVAPVVDEPTVPKKTDYLSQCTALLKVIFMFCMFFLNCMMCNYSKRNSDRNKLQQESAGTYSDDALTLPDGDEHQPSTIVTDVGATAGIKHLKETAALLSVY